MYISIPPCTLVRTLDGEIRYVVSHGVTGSAEAAGFAKDVPKYLLSL